MSGCNVLDNRVPPHSSRGVFFFCICALSSSLSAEQLQPGDGSFVFTTPRDNKQVHVWYHMPNSFTDASQILFVMHGVKRNGESYRDSWVPHAKKGAFLVLVPEFSKKDYPGSTGYNLGNMFSPGDARNDEASWSFTILEDLFDHVRANTQSRVSTYNIYGHSAGAQFVHRLVMFKPDARIRLAIAANAGWYTMPTDAVGFPYGLRHSGSSIEEVGRSFHTLLVILLGDRDTDKNHKYLRKTPEAMAQGQHRLARGQSFIGVAQNSANAHGIQLNWRIGIVPGVGHSNSGMSAYAAALLN